MEIEFTWECVGNMVHTYRAKVIGGWVLNMLSVDENEDIVSESSVFIPDPKHEWEIK